MSYKCIKILNREYVCVYCLYILYCILFIHNIVFLYILVHAHSNCFKGMFQVVGIQKKYSIGAIILMHISLEVFCIKFFYDVV